MFRSFQVGEGTIRSVRDSQPGLEPFAAVLAISVPHLLNANAFEPEPPLTRASVDAASRRLQFDSFVTPKASPC
jgi:hypothetical protein